jgi:WS/DGAT C-terminal domain
MAGAKITAVYPFASPVAGTPLVVALVSYMDRMDIGIDTDPEAIPDPRRLTELFLVSLDELASLALSVESSGDTRSTPAVGREPTPRRSPRRPSAR